MYPELEALLKLQDDDEALRAVESELASLSPRALAMDHARHKAQEDCTRVDTALARETERFRALESRIADHRARHDKNLKTLDQAHKLREATAAMAQVESAKKVVAEDESELLALSRKLSELRAAAAAAHDTLDILEIEQAEARAALETERAGFGKRMSDAKAKRITSASKISPQLLARYDRMNTRR